jgi:predicted transglutaminase-like cysteine proteinase
MTDEAAMLIPVFYQKMCRLLAVILFSLCCFSPSSSAEETIRKLTIAQEHDHRNGVWVVRPRLIDSRVVDLIMTNKIRTLDDYAAWMAANLSYKQDQVNDRWEPPESMLKSRKGDCEDFAFLTAAVLRVLGFEPHFLALVKNSKTHAICTFQKDNYFVWFDNAKLHRTEARSLEAFAGLLTKQFNYSRMLELNLENRQWTLVYPASS